MIHQLFHPLCYEEMIKCLDASPEINKFNVFISLPTNICILTRSSRNLDLDKITHCSKPFDTIASSS